MTRRINECACASVCLRVCVCVSACVWGLFQILHIKISSCRQKVAVPCSKQKVASYVAACPQPPIEAVGDVAQWDGNEV